MLFELHAAGVALKLSPAGHALRLTRLGGLIDIVASTPFRDAFLIARPTIQKPVYVLRADHVAEREALRAVLKQNRSPSAFRRQ